MLIDDVRLDREGDAALLSAAVRLASGSFSGRIEYRYFGVANDCLAARGDAFLTGMLVPAMKAGEDIIVDAPVSPRLLSRINRAIDLLEDWTPNLRSVKVLADPAQSEVRREPRGVGLFFSSGVDSFYSLLKNMEEYPEGPEAITHLVYVQDYGLPDPLPVSVKKQIVKQTQRVADETGKQLLLLQTNIRQGPPAGWRMHHGSALISHALPLEPLLRRCLIASGLPAGQVIPWGTHPDLDPLFSTDGMEIVHHGQEAYRTEKMLKQVVRSPLALSTLRLCSTGDAQPKNCGVCRKCLQGMIVLHSAGALDRATNFARPLKASRVWTMQVEGKRYAARRHLDLLGDSKRDRQLARGLRFAIFRFDATELIKSLLRPAWRRVRGLSAVG